MREVSRVLMLGLLWGTVVGPALARPRHEPVSVLRTFRGGPARIDEVRLLHGSRSEIKLLVNSNLHTPRARSRCEGYAGPSLAQLVRGDSRIEHVLNGNIFRSEGSGFRPSLFVWGQTQGVIQDFRLGDAGRVRIPTYLLSLGEGGRFRVGKIQVVACDGIGSGVCVAKIEDGIRGDFGFGWRVGSMQTASEFTSEIVSHVGHRGTILELNMPVFELTQSPLAVQSYLSAVASSSVPRTLACLRTDGTVSFLATGRASVPSLGRWALAHPAEMPCAQMFNLDGGGSTQLWSHIPGGWKVATRGSRRQLFVAPGSSPANAAGCPVIRPVQHYLALTKSSV